MMEYLKLLSELWQLKKNEKKARKDIIEIRDKKLRRILLYAYDHSSYYRKAFEQAGLDRNLIQTAPLSAFPVIDKTILLEHFDEIITVDDVSQEALRRFDSESDQNGLYHGKYHVVHSSGSTQKPGYFIYDHRAWGSMLAGIVRGALWDMSMGSMIKFILKKPRIVYIAATDGRYGGAMAVGAGIDGVGAKQLFLDIKTPLSEWIRQLAEFKPNMVIGILLPLKSWRSLQKMGYCIWN